MADKDAKEMQVGGAPGEPSIIIKATDSRAVAILKNAAKLLTGEESAAMWKIVADFQKYLEDNK